MTNLRIGSYDLMKQHAKYISQSQENIRKVSNKFDTKSNLIDMGSGDNLLKYISIHGNTEICNEYINIASMVEDKLDIVIEQIKHLIDMVNDVRHVCHSGIASWEEDNNSIKYVMSTLQLRLEGILNLHFGSDYIFAGSKSNVYPVPHFTDINADNTSLSLSALAQNKHLINSDYYKGDDVINTINIGNSVLVETSFHASHTSIKEFFAVLRTLQRSDVVNDDLYAGIDMMDDIENNFHNLHANMLFNKLMVGDLKTMQEEKLKQNRIQIEDINKQNGRDISSIVMEQQNLSHILNIIISVYGRLNDMSLSKILR